MYYLLGKKLEKARYFIIFTVFSISILLAAIYFKNDRTIGENTTIPTFQEIDLIPIKEFLFGKIKSPFISVNYKIKSGDTIQSVLKKFKIENQQIQNVINQYKKYSSPNKLLIGQEIAIVVEKTISSKFNSISKFSIPITNSTTIEIAKNDEGKLESKKIITRLYKKQVIAENIITKNLYSSAINANVNPDTIIEFARIFGFEIDFQRDIRKNDYFKIFYEKYFDENGEFIKSGSILFAQMSVNGRDITLYKFGNDKDYGYFDSNGKSVE